jgi:ligand-binding sensor domain-containing protein
MKNLIFLLTLHVLFTSCHGQKTIGKPLNELSSHLWYIFQDTKNNYWFASNGEGVYRYDGKSIINFTTSDGLANDTIRQIQEDKFGNIFITTFGGINKFDGKTFTTLQPIKSKEWRLEPDDLWFYVLGKKMEGVLRFDGEKLHHLEFPKHYLHDQIYPRIVNSFFSPYEVYSIYKDRKGAIWFGTSVFGACRFDGVSVKWMFEDDLTYVPNGGTFGIRSIFEDKERNFWFCNTWHKYIFDFDKTKSSDRLIYQKSKGIGNKDIFGGDEYIYYSYIVEDNDENIWLTTWNKGVFKYDGNSITNYKIEDNGQEVNLVSMYKDKKGNLWLGTLENGVFKFAGKGFEKYKL